MTSNRWIILMFLTLLACKNNSDALQKEDAQSDENEATTATEAPVLSTAETIAYKYGLEYWDHVKEVSFTFEVERPTQSSERSYVWNPKTGVVNYTSLRDTISYNLNDVSDKRVLRADRYFTNDQFWLFKAFHLVWDEGTTITEKQNQIAPMSSDTLDMLTITYGDQGGYTPGDAYDLYYGKDFIVKEWVYRAGNDSIPTSTYSWEDHKEFNGILVATSHSIKGSEAKINLTRISIK